MKDTQPAVCRAGTHNLEAATGGRALIPAGGLKTSRRSECSSCGGGEPHIGRER